MLQLKSQTKELFDKAGLGEFTIGRNELNNLAIVGPCGKSIVEVTNFSVGTKLSKDERTIAINEYLIPTLNAHSAIILDMITFKQAKDDAEDKLNEEVVKVRETGKQVGLDWSGYNEFKKFSISVKSPRGEDERFAYAKIDYEEEDYLQVDGRTSAEIKASVKVAEKNLVIARNLYELRRIHRDAIQAFNKAEESMTKECAL